MYLPACLMYQIGGISNASWLRALKNIESEVFMKHILLYFLLLHALPK